MYLELLLEKHNFRDGDNVNVVDRKNEKIRQVGKIYKIINLSLNENISEYKNIFVDYFYISFHIDAYKLFLKRGLKIIYNHKPAILGNVIFDKNGNVQKIYTQEMHLAKECEIDIKNINAILIWREAYNIL